MRDELIQLLDRLEQGTLPLPEFRGRVFSMLKNGLSKEIKPDEVRAFKNFTWCLDMYEPKLQPRLGILGKLKDLYAQQFHGEYRINEQAMRRIANELRKLLLKSNENRQPS